MPPIPQHSSYVVLRPASTLHVNISLEVKRRAEPAIYGAHAQQSGSTYIEKGVERAAQVPPLLHIHSTPKPIIVCLQLESQKTRLDVVYRDSKIATADMNAKQFKNR